MFLKTFKWDLKIEIINNLYSKINCIVSSHWIEI